MPSLGSRHDVVVGAGPAGLTAATTLRTAGLDVVCVEARDRVGGRLASIGGFDLVATWFRDGEQRVAEPSPRSSPVTAPRSGAPGDWPGRRSATPARCEKPTTCPDHTAAVPRCSDSLPPPRSATGSRHR
ncbi:NAD(P)-binding protein [Streptomyces sp. NPDC057424]|uniref:NAD(P)-binding protein n=1 Tax=Streptomyces sp. NPDC057424 TaxID=3346127 RepID=UPI00368FDC09